MKWAIEIREHDIDYQPRSGIKAQALEEFLLEIPNTLKGVSMVVSVGPTDPEANKEIWELHIDVVARKEGSGTG